MFVEIESWSFVMMPVVSIGCTHWDASEVP